MGSLAERAHSDPRDAAGHPEPLGELLVGEEEAPRLRSPIGRLVSLIKHMVGVALEKPPSRVRKSSDSPDRLSNATESRYRGSNATKVALESSNATKVALERL